MIDTSTNNIVDLADAIRQVGGKPVRASSSIKLNTIGSAKNKIWVDEVTKQKLALCIHSNKNIWMYGPAGVGKSTIAASILEGMNQRYYRIQGHSGFEAQDWYGGPEIDTNGKIDVKYTEIVKAMEEGIPVIVEEFNMIYQMHKGPVFSMLDDTKFVDIMINGKFKRVRKAPGFFMIVTANDNGTGDWLHLYGGGERENQAIVSRFNVMSIGYLPPTMEMEMIVEKTGLNDRPLLDGIMKIASETRQIANSEPAKAEMAISPRTMLSWAEAYVVAASNKATLNHEDIARMVVIDRLPMSMQDTVKTMVVNKLTGIKIHDIKYDK